MTLPDCGERAVSTRRHFGERGGSTPRYFGEQRGISPPVQGIKKDVGPGGLHPSLVRSAAPAFLSLLLAGCGTGPASSEAPADTRAARPAAAGGVIRPERRTVRRAITQPGHVEAFEQTPLFTKISGFVQKVHADIGDPVSGPTAKAKGQLLAELRVPEMRADLDQKKALVTRAQEEVAQSRENVKVAEAIFHSAEAKVREEQAGRLQAEADYKRWEVEYRKTEGLVKRNLLDEQTLEVTRYQLEAARGGKAKVEARVESAAAAVRESKARWDKAKVDVRTAEARLLASRADEAFSGALLEYAEVRAPYKGVVTARNVNTGDFLQPAAGAGTKGDPLFVVARIDSVRVFLEVPETDAVWIHKGARATIRVRGLAGRAFEGPVARTSWSLSPAARTLRTEIDLDNGAGDLRPGMYADATITVEHRDAWTLPIEAVGGREERPFCWRVLGGKAVRTPLQLGLADGRRVEVLKQWVSKGPSAGAWEAIGGSEAVLASNPQAVSEGQPVEDRPKR